MLCRQGPLDGCDVPSLQGKNFFLITGYNSLEEFICEDSVGHVYGHCGDEWLYQADATHQATEAIRQADEQDTQGDKT